MVFYFMQYFTFLYSVLMCFWLVYVPLLCD